MFGFDPLTAGSLLILAASGQSLCQMPKSTEINVIPKTLDIEYDYSRSLVDMQAEHVDTIDPYSFHDVTVTQGFMKGAIKMQPRVKLAQQFFGRQNAMCLWYDTVDISIEIDPSIVIASEIRKDRCLHAAVLEHEMKHVDADRRIVNKYAKIMGQKVYSALKQRGFIAGPVRPEAAQAVATKMQNVVFQTLEHEYKRMNLERTEVQAEIDSLEEYERVNALCPHSNPYDEKTKNALRSRR